MGEARATGAWIKTQRLAPGMIQEELAGKSGLSVRAISNLERGRTARPHPRSLDVLAVALGLPETAGTVFAARLRAGQARDASSQAPRQLPTAGERSSHPGGRGVARAARPGLLSGRPARVPIQRRGRGRPWRSRCWPMAIRPVSALCELIMIPPVLLHRRACAGGHGCCLCRRPGRGCRTATTLARAAGICVTSV
jgi:transcriptional regulator with XRE-family HTH domain